MRALIVMLLLGSVWASPLTPTGRVEALLMGYHGAPTRAVLESAEPGVVGILRGIASDAKAAPMVRGNALTALKDWPDDETFAIYAETLGRADNAGLLHRSILLLGQTFGARALPILRPWLSHVDVELRLTAVHAIVRIPGPDSGKALRARLANETEPRVRIAIQRAFDAVVKPGAVIR